MNLRAIVFAALLIIVAGCTSRPTIPDTSVRWDERRDTLLSLSSWQARGRIAVKANGDGGQGNIHWQQDGPEAHIRVNGPFGAGAYELFWSDDKITVTDKRGEVSTEYRGPDAAQRFLTERVGWSFPAISTRYWILGVAHPDYPAKERFDTDGWLTGIQQSGWDITYDKFSLRSGTWLPRRIVMENGDARVRVVVDRWHVTNP